MNGLLNVMFLCDLADFNEKCQICTKFQVNMHWWIYDNQDRTKRKVNWGGEERVGEGGEGRGGG